MRGEGSRTPEYLRPQITRTNGRWPKGKSITRIIFLMKMNELFCNTFKAMEHELGLDKAKDMRPMWQRRLSTESEFCRSLVACGYMTGEQMQQAVQRYRLGRSRDGGVIFWQIDEQEAVRDGKIMYYRPDCHRDHDRKPTWVSYLLKSNALLPADFKSEHCLFGQHLLTNTNLSNQTNNGALKDSSDSTDSCSEKKSVSSVPSVVGETVCVVESEKTAVIMSAVKPEYIWLATGGKTELTVAKLRPLAGRRVILFPDTDETAQTYRDWYDVAEAATDLFGHPFTVSSILEKRATAAQKAAKIDIADMVFTG